MNDWPSYSAYRYEATALTRHLSTGRLTLSSQGQSYGDTLMVADTVAPEAVNIVVKQGIIDALLPIIRSGKPLTYFVRVTGPGGYSQSFTLEYTPATLRENGGYIPLWGWVGGPDGQAELTKVKNGETE